MKEGLGWKIAGLLLGAILSVEGLYISIYLGPIQIKGAGEFPRYTVILAGVQLLILGLLTLLSWILREKGIDVDREYHRIMEENRKRGLYT